MSRYIAPGIRVVLVTGDEVIRAQIAELFEIERWGNELQLPRAEDEYARQLAVNGSDILLLIAEPLLARAERALGMAMQAGLSAEQILLFNPAESISHRILARAAGVPSATLDANPRLAVAPILRVGSTVRAGVLNREIQVARESGALALLVETEGGGNLDADYVERARLASALVNEIGWKSIDRRTLVRLALFAELCRLPHWDQVVEKSRHLWLVRDLLAERRQYLKLQIENDLALPRGSSRELVILETALLAQAHRQDGADRFGELLRKRLALIPIEISQSLQPSAQAAFASIWPSSGEKPGERGQDISSRTLESSVADGLDAPGGRVIKIAG